jgi:hypothetical protein
MNLTLYELWRRYDVLLNLTLPLFRFHRRSKSRRDAWAACKETASNYLKESGDLLRKALPYRVLIHHIMKVGSQTIQETLNRQDPDRPIFYSQLFELTRKGRREYREAIASAPDDRLPILLKKTVRVLNVRHAMRRRDGIPWKVITLIREPIGWSISLLFQESKYFLSYTISKSPLTPELREKLGAEYEKRKDLFLRVFTDWFDEEIRERFGIDLLSEPLDPRKGYRIASNGSDEVLVIRLEDLDRVYREAFREFLSIDLKELYNKNVGSEKPYKLLYEGFQREYAVCPEYAGRLFATRCMRRFYTPEEIEGFKDLWLARRPPDSLSRDAAESPA